MTAFEQAIGMADTFWPWQVIVIRVCVAAVFGAAIGYEREVTLHSAGLRTHILVAVAAALYTVLAFEMFHQSDVMANGRSDPVRAVEAVTAGIAFLGAGVIFRGRGRPRGLTTAAGMWLAGAVGMSAGLGFYAIGLVACVLALVILMALKAVDRRIDGHGGQGD